MFVQLNAKGQLTLPKAVRMQLGLQPGDIVELEVRGEEVILRPRVSTRIVVRTVPAREVRRLEGLVALGGDAMEDTERVHEP
ncbi:MAG: AbrB/MazE/SpoVT family DNA-binding domain-containing protein [Armatimonadetes bacterium]|nr:AbrB/MazE/SpoVT family DNA-binding domain-containing protein [Armatimonadota bacterium]